MAEAKPKKKWIKSAIKHPGALHRELNVPEGQKIPEAKIEKAASEGGKLGERARLAETLGGMRKSKADRLYKPKTIRRAA